MCGRFTIVAPTDEMLAWFELPKEFSVTWERLTPRYNVAPTQDVPIVVEANEGSPMRRELRAMRWGLVPHWADDTRIGNRLINARAETVAVKPAFRSAFRRRRCLVPATGFFEWTGARGKKQPWLMRMAGGGLFAFAGLWERWSKQGAPLYTFTIIVGPANDLAGRIHDRMPVVLGPADYAAWLASGTDSSTLESLLGPIPSEAIEALPVDPMVNDAANDQPGCLTIKGEPLRA